MLQEMRSTFLAIAPEACRGAKRASSRAGVRHWSNRPLGSAIARGLTPGRGDAYRCRMGPVGVGAQCAIGLTTQLPAGERRRSPADALATIVGVRFVPRPNSHPEHDLNAYEVALMEIPRSD